MQEVELTHTLSFGLDLAEGESANLCEAALEARRIRNEVNRLDREGWDWDDIEDPVVERTNHVKNTTQQIIDKALQEIETYHDHKDNKDTEWGRPRTYIDEPYPVRMNHGEGYALTHNTDTGEVEFRISYKKYNYVRGTLRGSPNHLERVKKALRSDDWRVGTAELVYKHGEWRLHVTAIHETHNVASKDDTDTIVGVDINEDCVALAAITRDGGVIDSVVIEYPDIKRVRHEFFTKCKRMQNAGQTGLETKVQTEERDFVHDQLHKVSRDVVEWLSQFSNPLVVFEDLKDMRDDIDYGTRMNRRSTASHSTNSATSSPTKPPGTASHPTTLIRSTRVSGAREPTANTPLVLTARRNGSNAPTVASRIMQIGRRLFVWYRNGCGIEMRMCRLSTPSHRCGR